MSESDSWQCVPLKEMRTYMVNCMQSVGSTLPHAQALAEVLLMADYRGHYSHGLNRLDMYVKDVKTGMTAKAGEPEVLKDMPATAWVHGKNLLGPVVGKFCIDLAIEKAKNVGIGMVVAKGSNHFGIAGWYSIRAQEQGLLGMAFTNTSPLVVPTRAKTATLGTNPITLAAPGEGSDSYVLDMATSTAAIGKVELNNRKDILIPSGWGCDSNGRETYNPQEVLDGGGLLPLGGLEQSGGYKGYGLGMMVEVLCGILGGATYGPNIRSWRETDRVADLGQCFIAINPNSFAPGFEGRMSDLMNHCRNLPPMDSDKPVLAPGDPERSHMEQCDKRGGIPYHPNQIEHLRVFAKELGVPEPKVV